MWSINNRVVREWELQGQILLYQSRSEKKSRENKISRSPDFIVKRYNNPKPGTQLRFIHTTMLPWCDKLSPHCLAACVGASYPLQKQGYLTGISLQCKRFKVKCITFCHRLETYLVTTAFVMYGYLLHRSNLIACPRPLLLRHLQISIGV